LVHSAFMYRYGEPGAFMRSTNPISIRVVDVL